MKKPRILRKRFIPAEVVDISSDILLFRSDDLLVTRWKPIKPRQDFTSGVSYTFLKDGIKISRFMDAKEELLYWYCDIIEVTYDSQEDCYTLSDLLVDVKVFPDGVSQVLDTDELAEALEQGSISVTQVCKSLRALDGLLKDIYRGNFPPKICLDDNNWK